MIIAMVGTFDDTCFGSIRGNGKSMSMVYFGYQSFKEGKQVYSNFKTSFSTLVTLNELLDLFNNQSLQNTIVLLDEAQVYLPNTGVKKGVINDIIGRFISQSRKRGIDIYLSTQRYGNLNNQLRLHIDEILLPIKCHEDGTQCFKDTCKLPHFIHVYSTKNDKKPLVVLDAAKVGKLYDTNEIIFDSYISQEEKEKEQQKQKIKQ